MVSLNQQHLTSLFVFTIHTLRKGIEIMTLDNVKFIQNWGLITKEYNVHVSHISLLHLITLSCLQRYLYPSVHVCVWDYLERKTLCVNVCVCTCTIATVFSHAFVCVSRVDVLKWGHFLSVWCLRNNPTAQKLLQPSASTYPSLYLYRSGSSRLLLLSASCRLVTACDDTITWKCLALALLLTIWGFDAPNWREIVLDRCTCKISDLGSNVCGTVLILKSFFHLFSLKSMPGTMPVSYYGGHSIWVNVRCYPAHCNVERQIWSAWLVQFHHSPTWMWIQLLP